MNSARRWHDDDPLSSPRSTCDLVHFAYLNSAHTQVKMYNILIARADSFNHTHNIFVQPAGVSARITTLMCLVIEIVA